MPTVCYAPIGGKVVRVTEVDACGAPVPGGQYVVSSGFVSLAISAEVESGTEYLQKNANGDLCVNERAPDSLKRLNLTVDWCNIDPDIVSLITGWPTIEDADGNIVGYDIVSGANDKTFAIELWSRVAGNACSEDGLPLWHYTLLPFVTGATLGGDLTFADATTTLQTTGYTQSGSQWGVGPWDVTGDPNAPTPLEDPVGADTQGRLIVVTLDPPTPSCGAQTITSPTSP